MYCKIRTLFTVAFIVCCCAEFAQAQTGIVFAGRADNAAGEKAHVTFIGDEIGGQVTGRLVVGGKFVSGDASGFFSYDPVRETYNLLVTAYDADLETDWRLSVYSDPTRQTFDIGTGMIPNAGVGYNGSGTKFVLNTH